MVTDSQKSIDFFSELSDALKDDDVVSKPLSEIVVVCLFTLQGRIVLNVMNTTYPSKHKTFVWHSYNVGPTSLTLGRRCINVIQIYWVWRNALTLGPRSRRTKIRVQSSTIDIPICFSWKGLNVLPKWWQRLSIDDRTSLCLIWAIISRIAVVAIDKFDQTFDRQCLEIRIQKSLITHV